MFKRKFVAEDIANLMEKNLVSNAIEDNYGFNKISKAVDYLNSAADIFDDVGLGIEAEIVTRLLESLAKKKDSKKSKDSKDEKKDVKTSKDSKKNSKKTTKKASDPYTDGITSEDMLNNLETTGTVFDYAADDCCMNSDDCEHKSSNEDEQSADSVEGFEDES